jgi:hypothetical protein
VEIIFSEMEFRHPRPWQTIQNYFLDIRALIAISQLALQTRTSSAGPPRSMTACTAPVEYVFAIGSILRIQPV